MSHLMNRLLMNEIILKTEWNILRIGLTNQIILSCTTSNWSKRKWKFGYEIGCWIQWTKDCQIRWKKTYTDRSPMVTGQSTEEAKGWKSRKMKTSEGHRKAANLWFFLMMCWFMALLSQAARYGTNEISHHSVLTSFFLFGFHFWIFSIFWRQFLVN